MNCTNTYCICREIKDSISPTRKGIGWCWCRLHRWLEARRLYCDTGNKNQCDPRFKPQDYPSFVRVRIIYSLLLLKTNASHHFSLVERQQVANHIMAASVDTKAFWQLIWAANSLNHNRKSSGSSCLLPWTVGNVLLSADGSMTRSWPCCHGRLYSLWYCQMFLLWLPPSMSQIWLQDFKI